MGTCRGSTGEVAPQLVNHKENTATLVGLLREGELKMLYWFTAEDLVTL